MSSLSNKPRLLEVEVPMNDHSIVSIIYSPVNVCSIAAVH